MNRMEDWIRARIRNGRRLGPAKAAAHWAERYLNAWYNTGFFDFERNGEAFLLREVGAFCERERVEIWDVGAHTGEYADCAHLTLPSAQITSFEIVPSVAEKLRRRGFEAHWFTLRTVGLSDHPGEVEVTCNPEPGTTSAINPRMGGVWFDPGTARTINCPVTTIDALVAEGVRPPMFLKIDVEGHEAAVLAGAKALLASDAAPLAIQFEYGDTWIPAGRTLHSVQASLEAAGYAVGRLYPDHVEFKPYAFSDEKFRMGNMVAVRSEDLRLRLAS